MRARELDLELIALSDEATSNLTSNPNNELNKRRSFAEIAEFRDDSGRQIYTGHVIQKNTLKHPEIFASRSTWTLAQMIDYCSSGQFHPSKDKFIQAVSKLDDPVVRYYIDLRRGKGELHKTRWPIEISELKDGAGNPIYSGHTIHGLKGSWTLAELIDLCFSKKTKGNSEKFIEALKKRNDDEVLAYIAAKEGSTELQKIHYPEDIEIIRNGSESPVYSRMGFASSAKLNSSIFVNWPRWTKKQLIDYCFSGNLTLQKETLIRILGNSTDREIRDYVKTKIGFGELYRLRKYLEIENILGEYGTPIYKMSGLTTVMARHPDAVPGQSWWKLKNMLDYCCSGRITTQKREFISAARRLNDPEVNAYLDNKLVSIDEIIRHEGFLSSVDNLQLAGLAIAYLLERTKSKTFLSENYSLDLRCQLNESATEIVNLIREDTISVFWEIVKKSKPNALDGQVLGLDQIPNKYQKVVTMLGEDLLACELWFLDLINTMDSPTTLSHAFDHSIKAEQNPHRKSRYQLLEVITFSRMPQFYLDTIKAKVSQIDSTKLSGSDLKAYQKALNTFN